MNTFNSETINRLEDKLSALDLGTDERGGFNTGRGHSLQRSVTDAADASAVYRDRPPAGSVRKSWSSGSFR